MADDSEREETAPGEPGDVPVSAEENDDGSPEASSHPEVLPPETEKLLRRMPPEFRSVFQGFMAQI